MKIKTILDKATQKLENISSTPGLDAELLLSHILDRPRSQLRANPDAKLIDADIAVFNRLLQRRMEMEPIAYILGQKEFWSLNLEITPDVLIPRPETELLIELVLKHYQTDENIVLADLGTGSGAVALAIASERPNWEVFATDKSQAALQLAAYNAKNLNFNNVEFLQGDWCQPLLSQKFDIIVSNPPYIAESDQHLQRDIKFEPTEALIAADNGLRDIKNIIQHAQSHLKSTGLLMLEHGCDQGENVRSLMSQHGYKNIITHKDLAGLERVTVGAI